MKALIQRVNYGEVIIDKKTFNEIQNGFVILLGIHVNDTNDDLEYLVRKIINLRIFDDENGVMNKSILDIEGAILSISQFTLQANTSDGNRPSYINAMNGKDAIRLYELFNIKLNELVKTYPGIFGADMQVIIENDGPVTIMLDSKNR